MKILAIVQARISSRRLPGKVLAPLAGKPTIARVFEQLSHSRLLDGMLLATSEDCTDDELESWANKLNVPIFRGPLNNVLLRVSRAAREIGKLTPDDAVVRITADCPIVEPTVADQVISKFRKECVDYCSNVEPRTFPDGYDVEVIRMSCLTRAQESAHLSSDLEHVTTFIRRSDDLFTRASVVHEPDLSHLRLTLDTPEDFENLRELILHIGKRSYISLEDVVRALDNDADLRSRITVRDEAVTYD